MKLTKNQKDFICRVLKTFVQGVLLYLITAFSSGESLKIDKTFLFGLIGAGLSAVMNLYKLNPKEKDDGLVVVDEDYDEDLDETVGEDEDE